MNTERPLTVTLAAVLVGVLGLLAFMPVGGTGGAPIPPIVVYVGYGLGVLALLPTSRRAYA